MNNPNASPEILQSFEQKSISSFNSSFDSTLSDNSISPLCSPTRNSLRNEGVYDEEEEEFGYNDLFNRTEKELREQSFEYEEPPIPYDEPKEIVNIVHPLIEDKIRNKNYEINDDEFQQLENDLKDKKVDPLLYKAILEEAIKEEEDSVNDYIYQINDPYKNKEKSSDELVNDIMKKMEDKINPPSMNLLENIQPSVDNQNVLNTQQLRENDKMVKEVEKFMMDSILDDFAKELIKKE